MSARFGETNPEDWPNQGVDGNTAPFPQMIVPQRGTNIVRLNEGADLVLKPEPSNVIAITEVKDFIWRSSPQKPRFFRIAVQGHKLSGANGVLVKAMRGTAVVAQLRVFVLPEKTFKLAIRPLKTDPSTFHAKSLPDDLYMRYEINEIWIPQANVRFELIKSSPAVIDDQGEIASALNVPFEQGVWHDTIDLLTYMPVFAPHVDMNADFTIFVVRDVSLYYGSDTTGATDPSSHKFAVVRQDADARVWAHELGHFLRQDGWHSDRPGDLMVSGGTGEKIPVDLAITIHQ
jgi:hypothetical protein